MHSQGCELSLAKIKPPTPQNEDRRCETDHFIALLPLATAFENFDALETLENVTLGRDGAGPFKTAMLRHRIRKRGADTTVTP